MNSQKLSGRVFLVPDFLGFTMIYKGLHHQLPNPTNPELPIHAISKSRASS
jgi:hypothetical protein